jgi:predicted O-methyltransferase YrrM
MTLSSQIGEPAASVLSRLYADMEYPADGGPRGVGSADPHAYTSFGFPVSSEQGELLYFLARAIGARRIVEFATSFGISTIYFAAAVRDNGGGTVIGTEIVPEKAALAQQHVDEAGVAEWVEIRIGDARETLRDTGGSVDMALIDGWPTGEIPSLAKEVALILEPQMRSGALMINDNAEPDYLEFVRDPSRGFRSLTLRLDRPTELSLKGAPSWAYSTGALPA